MQHRDGLKLYLFSSRPLPHIYFFSYTCVTSHTALAGGWSLGAHVRSFCTGLRVHKFGDRSITTHDRPPRRIEPCVQGTLSETPQPLLAPPVMRNFCDENGDTVCASTCLSLSFFLAPLPSSTSRWNDSGFCIVLPRYYFVTHTVPLAMCSAGLYARTAGARPPRSHSMHVHVRARTHMRARAQAHAHHQLSLRHFHSQFALSPPLAATTVDVKGSLSVQGFLPPPPQSGATSTRREETQFNVVPLWQLLTWAWTLNNHAFNRWQGKRSRSWEGPTSPIGMPGPCSTSFVLKPRQLPRNGL